MTAGKREQRTLTLVEKRRDAHAEALIAEDGLDPDTAGAYARQAHPHDEEEDGRGHEEGEATSPAVVSARGILHNAHDVDQLQAECQGLCNAMARLGAAVDMPRVEATAGVYALPRLLVTKGVCTEAEAEGERFSAMRDILRQGLQQVEIQATQRGRPGAGGPQVQPVRAPGIVVARH